MDGDEDEEGDEDGDVDGDVDEEGDGDGLSLGQMSSAHTGDVDVASTFVASSIVNELRST